MSDTTYLYYINNNSTGRQPDNNAAKKVMKILESKPAIQSTFTIQGQDFIFQTNYNHLDRNKKFYALTYQPTGKYLGAVIGKAHAKKIAKLFLSGEEPLCIHDIVHFLKTTYEKADFEQAMSGTTYMRINQKTIRISDHDANPYRAVPDLDLATGMNRRQIIEEIEKLLK